MSLGNFGKSYRSAMETPHFRKTLVGRAWADEWEYAHYENKKNIPQGDAVLDRRKMVTSFVFLFPTGLLTDGLGGMLDH